MRSYELLFIVRDGVEDDELDALVERIQGIISDNGGTILNIDTMGRRKLAYPIAKYTEGQYMIFQAEMDRAIIQQVERFMALSDDIIRHLLVRMDGDEA